MAFFIRIVHALFVLHPLHTMFVHFPIALTAAALFFIILALWRKSAFFEQVAFSNLALGSVSVIAAGITGMRDNLNLYNGAAPNIHLKISLAILLFAVTAATAFLRWRNPDLFTKSSLRWVYIGSYFVSFLLAAIIGFLGGVIVYGF
jgi:uncharacterized membrane protein